MKKVLWLIVCLMAMVVSFTSCGENIKEKYAVDNNEVFAYAPKNVVNEFFNAVDRYEYLHSKYDPSELTYVRTTLHVATDTLVVGEVYVRGRNGFGGDEISGRMFVFLKHDNKTYLNTISSDNWGKLSMRISLCDTDKEKNEVFSRFALAYGNVNDETDLECSARILKEAKSSHKLVQLLGGVGEEDEFLKYFIPELEESLGISKKKK